MTLRVKRPHRKTGRKQKPLTVTLEQLEIVAGFGLTEEEISRVLGICRKSLVRRKTKDPKFREALLSGKAKADMNVIKGLYTRATAGNDTTAAIFWLKNRQPERWRDRRDFGIEGKVDLELTFAFGTEGEKNGNGKPKDEEEKG